MHVFYKESNPIKLYFYGHFLHHFCVTSKESFHRGDRRARDLVAAGGSAVAMALTNPAVLPTSSVTRTTILLRIHTPPVEPPRAWFEPQRSNHSVIVET